MSTPSVAVVGSGIAGLSCAYLLSKEGFDVVMFEKHAEVGMDAHSVFVEGKNGNMLKLNTPPRSFGKGYYPALMELYENSGVQVEPWSWAWVAFVVGSYNPFILVDKTARVLGYALPTFFNWKHPLETLQLLRDGIRFSRGASRDITNPEILGLTLEQYLKRLNLSDEFIYKALLPTLSMVCTCSYRACLDYPAVLVLEFYAKTTTYGQFRTRFGTQDAVAKLTAHVREVKTGVSVKSVKRALSKSEKATVEYTEKGNDTVFKDSFDHIVMATQANHALLIVDDLSAKEKSLLESFQHETSKVSIHRDENVMPKNTSMWAPMSVGVLPHHDVEKGGSMFTIWMNDSFPDIAGNLFQTWNPVIDVDDSKRICEDIVFERPVVTLDSLQAVTELAHFQGRGGLWFCGAWNACRIPLQESGVQSSVHVVRKITSKTALKGGNYDAVQVDFEKLHLEENHSAIKSKDLYGTNLPSLLTFPRLTLCVAIVATTTLALWKRSK